MTLRVQCADLCKRFGATGVLERLNWAIAPGSAVALLGASGAGKTTLLRIVAGLESPSAGQVRIEDHEARPLSGRPKVGMVFQDLALWPHLTVGQHLTCVLPALPRKQREARAREALHLARLPDAAWGRRPSELSGGESQRLALARALAPRPGLLLLDEPLAQVDVTLRNELLGLMREVVASRRVTTVYVSHSCAEAAELCPCVAVLREGRIVAEGSPEEVFWAPASLDIARLTGPVTAVPRQLLEAGCIAFPGAAALEAVALSGDEERIYVRPQQLHWTNPEGCNCWEVVDSRHQGAAWEVRVIREGWQLSVGSSEPLSPGRAVGIGLSPPGPRCNLRPSVIRE